MTITIDGLERLRAVGEKRFLIAAASKVRRGRLEIVFPDGERRVFGGSLTGLNVSLLVRDYAAVRRILTGGATGFGEAYVDGLVDSPDLKSLMRWAVDNEREIGGELRGRTWYRAALRLHHLTRRNSRSGSRRNIASHYDLGNAFYAAWLDPGMNYSSAIYTQAGDSLADAQENKYRRLAELLKIKSGEHVLELGCGWGGLAEWLAREHGCRVTAITISQAQYSYAKERIAQAGLGDLVDIKLCDYRDLGGRFDKIVSVEMIEAVGERYWPIYFGALRDRLNTGGRAVLQAITIADEHFFAYRRSADFIRRYIFPGGMLPSVAVIEDQARKIGLRSAEKKSFGADYARTLDTWAAQFNTAWPRIAGLGFDQEFRRLWNYYLTYCAIGFETRRTDVHHLVLVKD